LIGMVIFAGELFCGRDGFQSWSKSPIADIPPICVENMTYLRGIEARIRIEDRNFPSFKGFDFSSFPKINSIVDVTANPGARVVATARHEGRKYPLLVWWDFHGAKIVVWTGSFHDIYGWETEKFFESGGTAGGPLFARNLAYFAAEPGHSNLTTRGYGSFTILTDQYHPCRPAGLRIYINRERVKNDEEARQLSQLVRDYVYVAPGVLRSSLKPGVEYVLTEDFTTRMRQALAQKEAEAGR